MCNNIVTDYVDILFVSSNPDNESVKVNTGSVCCLNTVSNKSQSAQYNAPTNRMRSNKCSVYTGSERHAEQ